jgi:hypothetical protein
MKSCLLRGGLALLASLLAACSSFDRHWKDAAQGNATCWDGHWQSGTNVYASGAYHHGRLRCVLVPQPDKSLTAYFHANWLIFSGDYDMTLRPVAAASRHRNVRHYEGTHDLPAMFGGTYHYRAAIAGDHFTADYDCRIDRGIFDLRQVPTNKESSPGRPQH